MDLFTNKPVSPALPYHRGGTDFEFYELASMGFLYAATFFFGGRKPLFSKFFLYLRKYIKIAWCEVRPVRRHIKPSVSDVTITSRQPPLAFLLALGPHGRHEDLNHLILNKKARGRGYTVYLRSKAFDRVNYKTLIGEVHPCELTARAFSLLKSYLSNEFRKADVVCERSFGIVIRMGIPQESILDPYLFLSVSPIYVNPIIPRVHPAAPLSQLAGPPSRSALKDPYHITHYQRRKSTTIRNFKVPILIHPINWLDYLRSSSRRKVSRTLGQLNFPLEVRLGTKLNFIPIMRDHLKQIFLPRSQDSDGGLRRGVGGGVGDASFFFESSDRLDDTRSPREDEIKTAAMSLAKWPGNYFPLSDSRP
ncbi:hypothetical protein EVAR_45894_1 [Eumeta japonica]|uniref:Uncharacterized protein n=1 Tax=Eumeta variegata TaxID=151549 RepID=A0A4C1XSE7_EUMVA|nr:hypothetical protein EVAR_45894_1 [Eumeta japonica]